MGVAACVELAASCPAGTAFDRPSSMRDIGRVALTRASGPPSLPFTLAVVTLVATPAMISYLVLARILAQELFGWLVAILIAVEGCFILIGSSRLRKSQHAR